MEVSRRRPPRGPNDPGFNPVDIWRIENGEYDPAVYIQQNDTDNEKNTEKQKREGNEFEKSRQKENLENGPEMHQTNKKREAQ